MNEYSHITPLPFNPQGWYENAPQMEKLFQRFKFHTVLEIGSWLGSSTRHIAGLLPQNGKLYAVDHWKGDDCIGDHPCLQNCFHQFLSNVIHAGLTDKIIPLRMSSKEAARALNLRPDLIYLDSDHESLAVYEDLQAWYPFVKGRGILSGDDWEHWPSVQMVVRLFAHEQNLNVHSEGNFWYLTEK